MNKKNKILKKYKLVKKIALAFLVAGIFSNSLYINIVRAATTDAVLFFNPASATIAVSDNLSLVARVNPGSNTVEGINAVQLDITFAPAVVHIVSVTAASPFALMGSPDIAAANATGTLSVPLFIAGSQIVTTSDVATLVFSGQGGGTNSPISFALSANAAVNDGSGTYVVGTRTNAAVTVTAPDLTAPTFTINDGVSATYVQSDTVNITVADDTGVASTFYGFSADNTCDGNDVITSVFTSGSNFVITGNHSDYLCLKATDSSIGANVGYQLVGQLHTDNTGPLFTINVGPSTTNVKTDTLNVTVADSAVGVSAQTYGFSADNTCNASDTIATVFASAIDFSITGDHDNYLCLKAVDVLGNVSYYLAGQLHIDNTPPSATQSVAVSAITNSNTPSYTFISPEAGIITYGGTVGCASGTTTAVAGLNTITFSALARETAYNCTIRVTDLAGNQGDILSLAEFVITNRGDINTDRSVNISDLSILATNWGKTSGYGSADINSDAHVNISDLSILAADFGKVF